MGNLGETLLFQFCQFGHVVLLFERWGSTHLSGTLPEAKSNEVARAFRTRERTIAIVRDSRRTSGDRRTASARAGSSSERPRVTQAVADPANGSDQMRFDGVDLSTQVADVGLDDAAAAAEVVLPDSVEQLRFRQHPTEVLEQTAQQAVLRRRQSDFVATTHDDVRFVIHREITATQKIFSVVDEEQSFSGHGHTMSTLGEAQVGAT